MSVESNALLRSETYRGIAPEGLRDLSESCRAYAARLSDRGREAVHTGAMGNALVAIRSGHRLERIATSIGRWVFDLVDRADAIDAARAALVRSVERIGEGLGSASCEVDTSPRSRSGRVATATTNIDRWLHQGWTDWDVTRNDLRNMAAELDALAPGERRSVLARLGIERSYRWLDELLLERGMSPDEHRDHLQLLIAAFDASELVALVDSLLAGGHSLASVAEIGRAVGAGSDRVILGVLDLVADRVESRDLTAMALAGHALAGSTGTDRTRLARWLADRSGRAAAVLQGASLHAEVEGRTLPGVDRVVEVLTLMNDPGVVARLVVDLIAEQAVSHDHFWLDQLDRAVARLIEVDPGRVMAHLAEVADPTGAAMVAWLRRLVRTDDGPAHLRTVVTGVVGPRQLDAGWFTERNSAGTFVHAETVGYIAGSLLVAVRLTAADAREEVAGITAMAALGELLVPAAAPAARAVEVFVPLTLGVGVGVFSRTAHERIDRATRDLLERIAERFELVGDTAVSDLGAALDAFDERRDALVQAWLG